MKHTLDELLTIVYRYYPRGVGITDDDIDIQARKATEEHARLVAARRRAAADERWHAMLDRVSERFPRMLWNRSIHLPTDGYDDACYSFTIHLPNATDGRTLWFHISFLVPYYIISSTRLVEFAKQPKRFAVTYHGLYFPIERSDVDPKLISNVEELMSESVVAKEEYVDFDLMPDERPCAEWIAREIETTFGCERMPPEVGTVLVPDLTINSPLVPQTRLYDYLFSDHHTWVNRSPSEVEAPVAQVDTSRLTAPFIAVLTVLAALVQILSTLKAKGSACCMVTTGGVGVLRKEDVLWLLAWIRPLLEAPETPRGIAAKRELEAAMREFEALVAAWDGEGAPPDAMVAWASSFLARSDFSAG
jgi:hypothetical protein